MTTDRELIELAAKAADIKWDEDFVCYLGEPDALGLRAKWNPLADDGDALRLAVKLGLDVCVDTPHENEPHTHVIGFSDNKTSATIDVVENHGDPYAATRRAIVRAAAEIGRTL